jgi:hypothetical protein
MIMASVTEVTRDCPFCHQPTTHHVTKPVSVRCKQCGHTGVSIGKRLIDAARQEARPAPKQQQEAPASPWDSEVPFDGTPRLIERNGTCDGCGAPAAAATPRGTLLWCGCGTLGLDAATAKRAAAAAARIERDARARRAAAERARAGQLDRRPPSVAERLDVAAAAGLMLDGIHRAADCLRAAPAGQLAELAAMSHARLMVLADEATKARSAGDPFGMLDGLQPYLDEEIPTAEKIGAEIQRVNAESDTAEALETARVQLLESRRAAAIILPPSTAPTLMIRRPPPPIKMQPLCQLRHRFGWHPATRVIGMAQTENAPPQISLSICHRHKPEEVCSGHGYGYYRLTEIGR